MSLNKIIIVGRLTATPELKSTQTGVEVTRFTVAADRNFQKESENKKTDFIECIAWRHTARYISQYGRKGDLIAVDGQLQTETYTDSNEQRRKIYQVNAQSVMVCSHTKQKQQEEEMTSLPESDFDEIDDELPF